MVDTITLRSRPLPLRLGIINDHTRPGPTRALNWYYKPKEPTVFNDVVQKKACLLFNGEGGRHIRLFLTNQFADGFNTSLPNLLFGRTGSILTSQDELDRSMESVFGEIGRVCEIPDGLDYDLTRVDLCLQFRVPGLPAQAFFTSVRSARHPLIHSSAEEWTVRSHSSGINFKGADMMVKFYDKGLELLRTPSDIVRIEIQLRGQALKTRLGEGGQFPSALQFDRCYEVYRDLLLRFPAIRHLPLDSCLTARQILPFLIASCENSNFTLPDGRRAMELFEQSQMRRPSLSKLRKEVGSTQLEMNGISFEELLPPQWPPPRLVPRIIEEATPE